MPPGPPPAPIELKRLRGNPGKERLPDRSEVVALAPADGIPSAPATLGDAGRAAWQRLWAAGRAWLSPAVDLDIMTRLCEAHDERAALRAELAATGYIVPGSHGQPRPNPLIRTLRELEAQMTRWEGLCGFTPADRARLGYAEVKRQSKLDELMSRRHHRGAG